MSDENTSPPLGSNLRGFRIQKKALFSHDPTETNMSSSSGISSASSSFSDNKPRRRIILPSESESDTDTTVILNQISPEKPELLPPTSVASDVPPQVAAQKRNMKTPSILEKEKQMKFLLAVFPGLEAMAIHDVLSKHKFNTDEAAIEIARMQGKDKPQSTYEQWKTDSLQVSSNNNAYAPRPLENAKRKHEEGSGHGKKKVKRRRKDADSDDEAADYKDRRVYDSDEDSDVEISNELTGDKKKVFEFLETGTLNELQLMNTCSKKKAELIAELRPFKGWIDLVEKLQSCKGLNTDLLNFAQQVLQTRNNVRHLMKKCSRLALQLEGAIAAGAGVKTQPRYLSSNLKLTGYQMVGLNWLAVLHGQGVNGILADEMGLGKTVQVISFLAHLKETGRAEYTHLVVVPASTLENWRVEFSRWCPELRVFMYYGSQEERRGYRIDFSKGLLADFDVVLTTYTTVGNSPEERKMFRITRMHYVIFDEAHMLKNMNTVRYTNLVNINAKHRILLTGTPLQNNLLELMSLLVFVMPKMFSEKVDDLKSLFQKNSKAGKPNEDDDLPTFEKEQIEQAKRIMKPFVLRRLKKDVLQDLPKKTDTVITVPMAPTQKVQYENLVKSFKDVSAEAKANNTTAYSGMSMMSDLRKISNHPLLLRFQYDHKKMQEIAKRLSKDPDYKDTVEQYILDDLYFMSDFDIHTLCKQFYCLREFELPDSLMLVSGKFIYLDKLLGDLKANGHRVLIFSQYVILLNIVEQYLRIRNHRFLRLDGSTPVGIRQDLINQYTEDKGIFIFLLSTRAGGLGINLTAADTVIIHDIDFNPYNDKQAEDRCHRMGQQRPVTVYRFISQGTIEEGMLQMNKEKLKLEREITTDESDNPDVKSVVRLLSSVLGVDSNRVTNLVSPKKKP